MRTREVAIVALLGAALLGCKGGAANVDAGAGEETPEQKALREAHDDAVALSASVHRAERTADLAARVVAAPVGQPVAHDLGQPVSIAASELGIVWADAQQGVVGGGDKAGGAGRVFARDLALSPTSRARIVAADGASVYWVGARIDRGLREVGVFRADANGEHAALLAPAADEPYELALGDDTLYWLERPRGGEAAGTATLRAVPKIGGAARALASIGRACALTADAKYLAWIELAPKAELHRSSLEGTEIATIAKANGAACSLAVDERGYTWPRPDLDQVLTAPKNGGAPRVAALVPHRPIAVCAAGASLLVATEVGPDGHGDGVLYALAEGGGAPRPLARAPHLASLVFDGSYPYWSAFFGDGGGGIYRGPKP